MKPAWNQLGDNFAESKSVIIGDVDCTVEKDLCSKYGVRGYPTIKYFTGATAADGDKYEGGRDYDSLKAFADENLGPSCGPDNRDLCSEEQLAAIDSVLAMSAEDRQAEIDDIDKKIADSETNFKDKVKKLQDKYQKLMTEKDEVAKSLSPRLRLLRSVHNKPAAKGHDEL